MISTRCPKCVRMVNVDDAQAGAVKCPKCGHAFSVAKPKGPPPASAPDLTKSKPHQPPARTNPDDDNIRLVPESVIIKPGAYPGTLPTEPAEPEPEEDNSSSYDFKKSLSPTSSKNNLGKALAREEYKRQKEKLASERRAEQGKRLMYCVILVVGVELVNVISYFVLMPDAEQVSAKMTSDAKKPASTDSATPDAKKPEETNEEPVSTGKAIQDLVDHPEKLNLRSGKSAIIRIIFGAALIAAAAAFYYLATESIKLILVILLVIGIGYDLMCAFRGASIWGISDIVEEFGLGYAWFSKIMPGFQILVGVAMLALLGVSFLKRK